MTIAKPLMLACLAAMSLGIGASNAQSLTPTSNEASHFAARVAATQAPESNGQIRSDGAHPTAGQR
jgi:hypothetical protein